MESISTEAIAEVLRAELGRRNLPKTSLVPVLGYTYTGINRRLNGKVEITAVELVTIADFLGTPVEDILNSAREAVPHALAGADEVA